MIVETTISATHLSLIDVFFQANKLDGVVISDYEHDIRGTKHIMLRLSWMDANYETAEKITYMAMIHCGIQNMLEDYLMKCNIDPFDLQPKSIKRQLDKENEEEENRKFNEHFNERKQAHNNTVS